MADSYTILWTKRHCEGIRQSQHEGWPLRLLFGGPHSSEPRFSRYGVTPGDWVYPVFVANCVLYIVGRVKVKRLMPLEEFFAEDPDGMATWWQWQKTDAAYLMPTCTDEALAGDEGTPIRLDLAVPPDILERIRFRSRQGERLLKHVEEGRLTHTVSLQGGVYRLSEASAQDFERVLSDG